MKSKRLLLIILFLIVISINIAHAENINNYNLCIPSIMYHKISDNKNDWNEYCISSKQLENDFEEIKKAGFTPINISEYILLSESYKEASKISPDQPQKIAFLKELIAKYPNPIMITFDDGYDDGYEILFPLLKKYGFKANISLIGTYIENSPGFLSSDEIVEMEQSGLVEFGNHTYSLHNEEYKNLQLMYALYKNYAFIKDDYTKNEALIFNKSGKYPIYFTYPYGISSPLTEKILDEMGVKVSLVTSLSSDFVKLSDNMRKISRINRVPEWSSVELVTIIINKVKLQNYAAYASFGSALETYLNNNTSSSTISSPVLSAPVSTPAEIYTSGNSRNLTLTFNTNTYNLKSTISNNITSISLSELLKCPDISTINYGDSMIYSIKVYDKEILINKLNNTAVATDTKKTFSLSKSNVIPVRAFFEAIGFTVSYNDLSKTINIYR